MTYLTVPIVGETIESAKEQIKAARSSGAEMLELRVDYLENLDTAAVENLIAEVKKSGRKVLPVIVTCRSGSEGGARVYPDQLRLDVLCCALEAGADFVDFEYESFLIFKNRERIISAVSQSGNGRLILSAHNFEGKFDNISKLYRRITTLYPAAIAKLVYKANHINDCFDAFDLLHRTSGQRIIFCMGRAGLVSRIIAKKLGSMVTFAKLDDKNATAPGQLTIARLKKLYRYNDINSETELYGIIASPVAHSLSPDIHNACFAAKKLNKLYLPLLLEGGSEQFERFLSAVTTRNWLDFRGFSVTIPHKQNAINYVRKKKGFIEPVAERVGAVNTIVYNEAGLKAYNTDYQGALEAITEKMKITADDFADMPVAVIGAGGVARAIIAGLSDTAAKIKIYNRTVEKARLLAAEFNADYAPLDDLQNIEAKLVINCTSIGMSPNVDVTVLPAEYIKKGMVVFDTVYNPAQTLLLKQAKEAAAVTIDGVSMFVNQACAQLRLFTGSDADAKLIRKTISHCLKAD